MSAAASAEPVGEAVYTVHADGEVGCLYFFGGRGGASGAGVLRRASGAAVDDGQIALRLGKAF